VKLKGTVPTTPLSPELRTLLASGPWAVGKTLRDLDHDTLRRLWAIHGPSITASLRGREAWFVGRDAFVKAVRGEE